MQGRILRPPMNTCGHGRIMIMVVVDAAIVITILLLNSPVSASDRDDLSPHVVDFAGALASALATSPLDLEEEGKKTLLMAKIDIPPK